MAIANNVETSMKNASWIRRMFEVGIDLKKKYGADKVFDFSIGNPILEPPEKVIASLRSWVNSDRKGQHRYMPNNGYPDVRETLARHYGSELNAEIVAEDVIMTVGAAGALNCCLKALLNPGDEVIVVAPYFPEYYFYIDNHQGQIVEVESTKNFDLDLNAFADALTEKTKAIILNSPNNPTGRIYSTERLGELGKLLAEHEARVGHPVTILSDEPYRKILFDGAKMPNIFDAHPNTVFITSHSKDLGLAGERIGYGIVSPRHADREALRGAITFVNRTLGFVNAPALFQHAVAEAVTESVPIEIYAELRDVFCKGLDEAGIDYYRPQGAFYLFPFTPGDDIEFCRALQKYRILSVPGAGFSRRGHLRLSFCVKRSEVEGSLPFFKQAVEDVTKG